MAVKKAYRRLLKLGIFCLTITQKSNVNCLRKRGSYGTCLQAGRITGIPRRTNSWIKARNSTCCQGPLPAPPTQMIALLMLAICPSSKSCHGLPGTSCSSSSQVRIESAFSLSFKSLTPSLSWLLWHRKRSNSAPPSWASNSLRCHVKIAKRRRGCRESPQWSLTLPLPLVTRAADQRWLYKQDKWKPHACIRLCRACPKGSLWHSRRSRHAGIQSRASWTSLSALPVVGSHTCTRHVWALWSKKIFESLGPLFACRQWLPAGCCHLVFCEWPKLVQFVKPFCRPALA